MRKQPTKFLVDRLNLLVVENPTLLDMVKPNMATSNATKYVSKTICTRGLFIFLNYPIVILDLASCNNGIKRDCLIL
jgi:hypothetical protein